MVKMRKPRATVRGVSGRKRATCGVSVLSGPDLKPKRARVSPRMFLGRPYVPSSATRNIKLKAGSFIVCNCCGERMRNWAKWRSHYFLECLPTLEIRWAKLGLAEAKTVRSAAAEATRAPKAAQVEVVKDGLTADRDEELGIEAYDEWPVTTVPALSRPEPPVTPPRAVSTKPRTNPCQRSPLCPKPNRHMGRCATLKQCQRTLLCPKLNRQREPCPVSRRRSGRRRRLRS